MATANPNVIIAYGVTNNFEVEISGVSPIDLTSPFSTDDYDSITGSFVLGGVQVPIAITVVNATTLFCSISQGIFTAPPNGNTFTRVTMPEAPARIIGTVGTTNYMLAQFTIQISPAG